MKTKLFFSAFFFLVTCFCHGEVIMVDDSCIRMNDLYPSLTNEELICNLNYGDKKKIPKERIKNELAALKLDIKQYPPRTFHVVRKGVEVKPEALQSKIHEVLLSQYPDTRIEIEKLKYRNKIFGDESGFLDIQIPKKGFGSVYATVFNGVKKYRIYVYVRAYQQVYMTTDRVYRGEMFVGKTEFVEKEITKVRGNLIHNLNNYIAKQNIAPGKIVTSKLTEGKPVNFEGDHVSLIYESGTIRVSTTGVLEENAYMGKSVKVRNVSSGKVIYARAKTQDQYITR